MKEKHYYVIRFDNGAYWTGYNNYSDQVRLARIYTSIKHCRESAEDAVKRLSHVNSYKIIEIKIDIIGEVNE